MLENIVNPDKRDEVKKKLLFGEVIQKSLSDGFQDLVNKEKRQFTDVVVKDRDGFKKPISYGQFSNLR